MTGEELVLESPKETTSMVFLKQILSLFGRKF